MFPAEFIQGFFYPSILFGVRIGVPVGPGPALPFRVAREIVNAFPAGGNVTLQDAAIVAVAAMQDEAVAVKGEPATAASYNDTADI